MLDNCIDIVKDSLVHHSSSSSSFSYSYSFYPYPSFSIPHFMTPVYHAHHALIIPSPFCFQGDASIMVQPGSFHPPIMGHMGASHQEARHLAICSFFIPYVIIMSNKASGCFIYLPHLLRSRGALTRILYTEVTPFWLSAGVSSHPFAPCLIHNSKLT